MNYKEKNRRIREICMCICGFVSRGFVSKTKTTTKEETKNSTKEKQRQHHQFFYLSIPSADSIQFLNFLRK